MTLRSIGLRLINRLPSSLAARLRGDSAVAGVLRPISNRVLPTGPTVVEVRSGLAAGILLEIFPQSEKYYWLGTYETEVLQEIAARLRPGSTYWDVGAHAGYMVAVASRIVGPAGTVVAFEPNPDNVRRLLRTIELNNLSNVTVRDVALSDGVGQARFYLTDSSSTGSLRPGFPLAPTLLVRTSTLDEELKAGPTPDLVKIDVEGSEEDVFAGAIELLEVCRPDFVVEVLTPERRRVVEQTLDGYGTSMLDGRNMVASPRSPEGLDSR